MVYNNTKGNRFVVAVKVDGRFCEELANGQINIPFNSEYSIRLKNKNSRAVCAKITIDGEEILPSGIHIPAHSHVDVEHSEFSQNKFKFVSLDSSDAIGEGKNGDNHNKIKGVIDVKFYYEKVAPETNVIHVHHNHYDYYHWPYYRPYDIRYRTHTIDNTYWGVGANSVTSAIEDKLGQNLTMRSTLSKSENVKTCAVNSLNMVGDSLSAPSDAVLQDGCTVEGGWSNQHFGKIKFNIDENNYYSMKVFLQGYYPTQNISSGNIIDTKQLPNVTLEANLNLDIEEAEITKLQRQIELLKLKKQLEEELKALQS